MDFLESKNLAVLKGDSGGVLATHTCINKKMLSILQQNMGATQFPTNLAVGLQQLSCCESTLPIILLQ